MAHCSVPELPSKCKIIEKLGEQGEKGSYSKVNWNVNCHSKCYRHLFLWCLHKEAEKIECTILIWHVLLSEGISLLYESCRHS